MVASAAELAPVDLKWDRVLKLPRSENPIAPSVLLDARSGFGPALVTARVRLMYSLLTVHGAIDLPTAPPSHCKPKEALAALQNTWVETDTLPWIWPLENGAEPTGHLFRPNPIPAPLTAFCHAHFESKVIPTPFASLTDS